MPTPDWALARSITARGVEQRVLAERLGLAEEAVAGGHDGVLAHLDVGHEAGRDAVDDRLDGDEPVRDSPPDCAVTRAPSTSAPLAATTSRAAARASSSPASRLGGVGRGVVRARRRGAVRLAAGLEGDAVGVRRAHGGTAT